MSYVVRMAMLESLEMRNRFCCWSIKRESHILKNELQELPKMPKELIERLTKETNPDLIVRKQISPKVCL